MIDMIEWTLHQWIFLDFAVQFNDIFMSCKNVDDWQENFSRSFLSDFWCLFLRYITGRYLFWTDCGKRPKIERSELDGSSESRREIVTTNIHCPVGLTVGVWILKTGFCNE